MAKAIDQFWKDKSLDQLNTEQWEQLCDGCGLCCLHKLEDADTKDIAYTNVACRLLNIQTCRCIKYSKRKKLVPDCVILNASQVDAFHWLPKSCAYRLISQGKDLYNWHPLINGSSESVHDAGISVRGKAISEREAGDMEDHIIHWVDDE